MLLFLYTNTVAGNVEHDFITFHPAVMTEYFSKYFTDVNTDE